MIVFFKTTWWIWACEWHLWSIRIFALKSVPIFGFKCDSYSCCIANTLTYIKSLQREIRPFSSRLHSKTMWAWSHSTRARIKSCTTIILTEPPSWRGQIGIWCGTHQYQKTFTANYGEGRNWAENQYSNKLKPHHLEPIVLIEKLHRVWIATQP